jgi:hypothetical protein
MNWKFWKKSEPSLPELPSPKTFIEVSQEDTAKIQSLYKELHNKQLLMGQITFEYEKKKSELYQEQEALKSRIQAEIDACRRKHGIPDDDEHYSLTLPSSGQKVAVFMRDVE